MGAGSSRELEAAQAQVKRLTGELQRAAAQIKSSTAESVLVTARAAAAAKSATAELQRPRHGQC